MNNDFPVPVNDRYFEDYLPGMVLRAGSEYVDQKEVIDFGARFDPQWIHTDPSKAAEGPFQGLIASGWHTASLMMRIFANCYINQDATLGGAGVDDLRWTTPVRPDDVLSAQFTVVSARRSRSKPDRGLISTAVEVYREDGTVVMTLTTLSMLRVRPHESQRSHRLPEAAGEPT
ncbi:MaoC family dehydratase [Paenarthrobacter sp. NPDC058040]|uniref:MaoC family dehydratase n=1 Tax=unclassified Paenarthrobacter TaxID=2634190 RepID=UPI0036D873F2